MKIELNIYEIKYLTMMLEDTFTEEEITPILIQDLYSKLVVLKKKTPLMGKNDHNGYRCISLPNGDYIQVKYEDDGIVFDRYDEYNEHQEAIGFDMYHEISTLTDKLKIKY